MSWTDPNKLDGISTETSARHTAWDHFLEFNEKDENVQTLLEYNRGTSNENHAFLETLVKYSREFGNRLERARFKNDFPQQAHEKEEFDNVSPYGEVAEARGVLQDIYMHLMEFSDVYQAEEYEDLRRSLESELEMGLESTENAIDSLQAIEPLSEPGAYTGAD